MSSYLKYFTAKNIIIVLIVFILIWGIWTYSGSKNIFDNMSNGTPSTTVAPSTPSSVSGGTGPVVATVAPVSGYALQPISDPSQLLPKDHNNQWTTLNPTAATNNVIIPDLLEAGYHIGLDTIGQTLKNPNLQERSEPIIPKQSISPWNNSSFEPDLGRVPLEIGYGVN